MINRRLAVRLASVSLLVIASTVQASNIELFNETFNGITTGYSGYGGHHSGDQQQFGVPNNTGGTTTADGGADENWYGARFERPDGGTIAQDVGIQENGGGTNPTPTGLAEDDAGLMFRLDTTGLENIQLSFDWRTFSVNKTTDRFVAGYFVGDLDAGHPVGFAADNTIDLRNAIHGGTDGAWNWNPINGNGNVGDWNELLRGTKSNDWQGESFNLSLADDASEIWVAFWLDNGENDFAKFDNIVVTADSILPPAAVPVPAAVWLFGSGLIALAGVARRRG